MRVVITYRHQGNDTYLELIKKAFASARKFKYDTMLIAVGMHDHPEIGCDFRLGVGGADMPLMDWILWAQYQYLHCGYFSDYTVLFSPDAIFLKDVTEVFQQKDFDIAVTVRDNQRWPVNNGVIYLKPGNRPGLRDFFLDCYTRCQGYEPHIRDWYGDQLALHQELEAHNDKPYGLKCLRLPCEIYNANPPGHGAYIAHYKGKRKEAMLCL